MKLLSNRLGLAVVALTLVLTGAGCAGSAPVTPGVTITPKAQGLITVTSPRAGDTVTNPLSVIGKSPAGQTVFAAAMVNDNLVSLTLGQPDEAGNFTLPSLGLDAVLVGDFSLVVYNINDNGDWLNQVTIPLKLKP